MYQSIFFVSFRFARICFFFFISIPYCSFNLFKVIFLLFIILHYLLGGLCYSKELLYRLIPAFLISAAVFSEQRNVAAVLLIGCSYPSIIGPDLLPWGITLSADRSSSCPHAAPPLCGQCVIVGGFLFNVYETYYVESVSSLRVIM